MRLYFFRHAIAEDGGADLPDYERKLTDKGIAKTRRAAEVMQALKVKPTHIYSSPLVRARQTADILAEALGVAVEVREEVAPGFNIAAVTQLTNDLDRDAHVLFVGHEPDFSATVSALTGGSWVVMKKGGLARVDITGNEPIRGELVWLIAPKVFGSLG